MATDESTPAAPAIGALRPGQELNGLFACTRKDRLTTRTGSPYLALELRDRTGTLSARAFQNADALAGRFERGEIVRVRGRVERFRDELVLEVSDVIRADAGEVDPGAFLPTAYRDLDELDGFSSTSPARSTTVATRRCWPGCWVTRSCAPSGGAPRAPATPTTPTSVGCSSTPSGSRRSPTRPASCTRASTPTCSSARRWSTTSAAPASSPTARRSGSPTRAGSSATW